MVVFLRCVAFWHRRKVFLPEINISVVMGQIIMTVKAIDWTEGNVRTCWCMP